MKRPQLRLPMMKEEDAKEGQAHTRGLESCRLPLRTDAYKSRETQFLQPRLSLMKEERVKRRSSQTKGLESCRLLLKTDADKSRDNETPYYLRRQWGVVLYDGHVIPPKWRAQGPPLWGDVRMPVQQPDHSDHLLNEHLHGGAVGEADEVETGRQTLRDSQADG